MRQTEPATRRPRRADSGVEVVVARVTNADGSEVWSGVFSSHAKAMAGLASYCRSAWEEQRHDDKLPRRNRAAVTRYFEFWAPEMTWEASTETVDGECPP